jgi:hypothetical protein
MEYITTKQRCQENIEKRGKVCPQCGEKLTPIETWDKYSNPTFWAGCIPCKIYNIGVPPIIEDIAEELYELHPFRYYSHIIEEERDDDYTKKYKKEIQIAGICIIVQNILRIYEEKTTWKN